MLVTSAKYEKHSFVGPYFTLDLDDHIAAYIPSLRPHDGFGQV
jgi:hypothetical protein